MKPVLIGTRISLRSGPVSAFPSVTCIQNNVSHRRPIRHVWRCLRTSIRVFWANGAKVFDILAANTFQHGPISGAAQKRTSRPRANTHPDQPGPETRKRCVFYCFRNTTYTPNLQAINFQSMRRCKLRKWPLGQKWNTFPPRELVYDFGTRVGNFKI